MLFLLLFSSLIVFSGAKEENILLTEVFEIVVNPALFNWTYEGNSKQFVYLPSLLNAPDLPSWINYVFSARHHCGYLFGVPPTPGRVQLEIVALDKKNYETRHKKINIHVNEKLNPAKYEVHLKIDNLNVEDMFEVERMERLKDIFRKHLWKDSDADIYVTFLASALKLGARKPPNPREGEGVVLRLGSQKNFSSELTDLQEEVRPLWKVPSCPRDFKRTSVERFFRNAGFAMDWCSFRLIEDTSFSALHQSELNGDFPQTNSVESEFESRWETVSKDEVPQRSYSGELLFTVLVPLIVMTLLALVLSIILCFHHEGISKRLEDVTKEEISQFTTIQRATQSLRSLSNNRDISLSPDPGLLARTLTDSPTSTVNRGVHCRPSPPPYVRPKFKPAL